MIRRISYLEPAKLLLVMVLCVFTVIAAVGQGTGNTRGTNMSQLSNQQILMMWQQAQKNGGSDNDAIRQLIRNGLNPADVNAFKKKLLQAQNSAATKPKNAIIDSSAFLKDSGWVKSVPQMRKVSPYYGFDFFSNPDVTFEPNLSIAPPKNYVLGPGDALTITLTGLNELSSSDKITRDGGFQVPHGDIINLSGLTIDQAREKIRAKMKPAYPGLAAGQTNFTLTLDNARNINVYIIGEVERPGRNIVSALSSFFNVLYLSGGPSEQGSLRKIELIRGNKPIATFDFYSFLQKGIFNNEIRLEDQDIIRIPVYTKRVTLDGEVKRPAIYELLEKETLADLLSYGGGFQGSAYTETAKVVQVGGKEKKIRDVNLIDFPNFIPMNADSVHIDHVLPTFLNRVVISGAVQRPGDYELTDGMTLLKLISKADGLRDDAFSSLGNIKRRRSGEAEKELISFDLKKIQQGGSPDIVLIKNDSVFIASRDNVTDNPTITVTGNVKAPGTFEFRKGMSVEDAILMAGGFTNDAANHKVEITRLEKNKSDTLANQLSNTRRLDIDSSLTNKGAKTLLEPLDYINVPRLLNYRMLGNVRVTGEVLYVGEYALERRDETIQEIIQRAGGLSPYASLSNTQVFRSGVRVATTAFADKNNTEKFLLLPGDSIHIPRDAPFVEVVGAVFNPQILRYESPSFTDYISDAGGTTDKGNLKKAYIQYSNGVNRKIKHFLFFRTYPKVLPGSKIFVPEKSDADKKTISVLEISAFASVLGALAAVLSVIRK